MAVNQPAPLRIQPRQPSDLAGTVRFTDLSGGSFKQKAQAYFREELEPICFDAQNMDMWSRPGQWFLCPKINQIGGLDAADHEYLLYTFNQAVYKLPTVTGVAADIQKIVAASGVPVWAAIANPYPGAFPIRNAVVWKNQLVIAAAEQGAQALRAMAAAETWTAIAAAAPAPTTANALQVGIGPDDKLMVWFQDTGLFTYDGTSWLKVFPTTAATAPVEGQCDLLMDSLGSTIFALRDASDIMSLWEYSIESTGSLFIRHLHEYGMRIWPQGLDVFNGAAWFVVRMGSRSNRGILFRKEKLAAPEPLLELDTNLQGGLANDGRGLDWAWRTVKAFGDVVMVGGSSRQDHSLALFRATEDENGLIFHPSSCLPGVDGPVYSMAVLPTSAAGVFGTERLFLSGTRRTFYKDRDDGVDPTADADEGWVQFPDIDYGAEDRAKIGRFIEAILQEKGTGATDEIQYRIDPATPSAPWAVFGQINTITDVTTPPTRLPMGHDNEAAGRFGRSFRRLQLRTRMTRATSGSARSRLDAVAVDSVAMRPPGSA